MSHRMLSVLVVALLAGAAAAEEKITLKSDYPPGSYEMKQTVSTSGTTTAGNSAPWDLCTETA